MIGRNSAAAASVTCEADRLDRLRACLAATTPLVRGIAVTDERIGDSQTAYALDLHAFEIAVEAVLFFEAVGKTGLVDTGEMHSLAGPALEATASLRRSVGQSLGRLTASGEEKNDVLGSLRSLSEILEEVGSRLESLCRSLIITELCSMTLSLRARRGEDGSKAYLPQSRRTSGHRA